MDKQEREPGAPARRIYLCDGALVLAFTLLPRTGAATPWLDAWIRIAPDGAVTVCSGMLAPDPGLRAALVGIAARQLALAPDAIGFIAGDTARQPDTDLAAATATVLRNAVAQVAAMLHEGAATRWRVRPDEVMLQDGQVRSPGGRAMHYGAAIAGMALPASGLPAYRLSGPVRPMRQRGVRHLAMSLQPAPTEIAGAAS